MENQKLLDLDNDLPSDLPEHDPKTKISVPDDDIFSEDLKDNHENDVDDLILMPEKVINTEKPPLLENTFEVIEEGGDEVNTDVINISKDEVKEKIFESDPVNTKIEDHAILPKTESPKKEPVVLEKSEPNVTETTKTIISQENEPLNVVQPEDKIASIPVVNPKEVSPKKDTDEGDVCDIKIGPEELFCRIGLGKLHSNKYIFIR